MERLNKFIESLNIPSVRLEREKMISVVNIAAATAVLYSSYKLISNNNKKKNTREQGVKEIPCPKSSYPFVGHMLSLGSSPGKQFSDWHKELGHIFKLQLGIQTWILIDDPLLAQKIFTTNGSVSSNRPHVSFCDYNCARGEGIGFAQPVKQWKNARAAVSSMVAPKEIDNVYMRPLKAEAINLVNRLVQCSKEGNGVNPHSYLLLNSLNLISMATFGKTFGSIEDPGFLELSGFVKKATGLASIEHDLSNFLPVMIILDYINGKHAMMKDFIDKERDPLFFKLMAEAIEKDEKNFVKELSKFDLSEDEKLLIIADLIIGGTDTVSTTLSWVFALLCNYSLVQKKAADEIDQFIKTKGKLPEFSDRHELPYCISVIKECLRFRPITVLGLPHATQEEIFVDGYIIPKGVTLITSMESIHQNPNVYSEPLRFYPERFLNNTKTLDASAKGKVEERDQFNFGWGRRLCPGIYMAEAELFTTFVQVFSRCTIEPFRDPNGKEYYPDVETIITIGLNLVPLPYKINIVERRNPLSELN